VTFTIFSGTAPLVATALIRETASLTAPAMLMMGCALLAALGSVWVERLGGHVLRHT
jgi:hypothetical protein